MACPGCLGAVYCSAECMIAARGLHSKRCSREINETKAVIKRLYIVNQFPFTRLITLSHDNKLIEVPVPVSFALANPNQPACWPVALEEGMPKTVLWCPQLMLQTSVRSEAEYRGGKRLALQPQKHSFECRRRCTVVA